MFTVDGETYLQSAPSPELLALRDASKKRSFKVNGTRTIKEMIPGNDGAYEIELTIENQRADVIGFRLYNDKGEEVDMPTKYGHFRLIPFLQKSNGLEKRNSQWIVARAERSASMRISRC